MHTYRFLVIKYMTNDVFVTPDMWLIVISDGWVDVMTTPIVAISITYTYHPVPPTGEDPLRILEEPISTPEAEEQLLIPLRLVPLRPLRPKKTKLVTIFFVGMKKSATDKTAPKTLLLYIDSRKSTFCAIPKVSV